MLQHGDRRAEIGEHRSELKSDESGADDHQPLRKLVDVHQTGAGVYARSGANAGNVRNVRRGTGVDEHHVRGHGDRSVGGGDFRTVAPVKRARPVITVMLPWSASLW